MNVPERGGGSVRRRQKRFMRQKKCRVTKGKNKQGVTR